MEFLKSFFRRETPASDKSMPQYYRKALFAGEVILCVYFLISLVAFACISGKWIWQPTVIFLAGVGCALNIDRFSARVNLRLYAAVTALWCAWYIYRYGWSCGSQHLVPPVLALVFFNVYETPRGKIAWLCLLIVYRVLLFVCSLRFGPVSAPGETAQVILQIYNSITPMLILAVYYILFSSSIQESERSLILNNQELHKEAGTDPLTQLPNRRSMLDTMDTFMKESPSAPFCIAIADIDFFKHVNDTYGHPCGDYTLQELSRLFRENAEGKYNVCRWGGE